jgi:dTDP-4-amino-4,6-dideoxygalactose transaminase
MSRVNPFEIVRLLESEIAAYTASPMVVCVDSCTNALGIVLEWQEILLSSHPDIEIPKRTYIGVPMQILRAHFNVKFREEDWEGEYRLRPHDIWDSARRFRRDMWHENGDQRIGLRMPGSKTYKCVSFHRTKILGHTHGGAILHNDHDFDDFAREVRFDGRKAGVPAAADNPRYVGRHCYMDPDVAAALLHKMYYISDYNPDLPKDAYPDLSQMDLFK